MASADISADEGEISEAIALPRSHKDGEVDRKTRDRFSHTPDVERSRDGSLHRRSQSPRGFKRPRDDRDRREPRQFRVHYESTGAGRDDRRHGRDLDRPPSRGSSYRDLDRPASRGTYPNGDDRTNRFGNGDSQHSRQHGYRQDDRSQRGYDRDRYDDDHSSKRFRNRSRSPHGYGRGDRGRRDRDRFSSDSLPDNNNKYGAAQAEKHELTGVMSKRFTPGQAPGYSKQDAAVDRRVPVERGINGLSISQPGDKPQPLSHNAEPEPEPDLDWDPSQELDKEAAIEAEIQRRRRAREAAYKRGIGAMTPTIQSLQAGDRASSTPESSRFNTPAPQKIDINTPQSNNMSSPALSPSQLQEPMSPALFNFADDQELTKANREDIANEDGPYAADYDPIADMKEDERRDEMRHGHVGLHGEARHPAQAEDAAVANRQPDGAPTNSNDDDDDDFDMFAEDFDEDKFTVAVPKKGGADGTRQGQAKGIGGGIVDGDDKDGYYKIRPGEVLDSRYRITDFLGRGMFSGVARADDVETNKVVAVKIMRNNDALRKGGFTEIAILQKLNSADPEDKKHIIRFGRSFEYNGHLCMTFENLNFNLREVLKKYGNNVGINLNAVRSYAYQIFVALAHMRNCHIIHADLKPDNILVNESKSLLKICDLGTAIDRDDAATSFQEITPYLVSRFYRAPEIILGIPYDYSIDMWSIGCTLYELYTGRILFRGNSNNQMLRFIQDTRGKLSSKLFRRGQLAPNHFDPLGNFISAEPDKMVAGKINYRTIASFPQSGTKLRDGVLSSSKDMTEAQTKDLNHFIDLLERCLALNPDKRIEPADAIKHEFITRKPPLMQNSARG